jgi:hypothetical protein
VRFERFSDVGSGGFIGRFLLGMAGGLAAVTLLVGWLGVRPQGAALAAGTDGGSWASQAELTWLAAAGRWETHVLRRLDRCDGTPRAAPSARLEQARAALGRACAQLARGNVRAAMRSFLEANELLPPGETRDLPVIAGPARVSRIEPRFGRIASVLAGKDVDARCWSRRDWAQLMREESTFTGGQLGVGTLGFAGINGSRVNFAPEVCAQLVELAYGGRRVNDYALATAVVTLSHEAQHSRGIAGEAEAECYAIQVAQRAAAQLGAGPQEAASLVLTYWRHYADELPAYRSPDCRKGGSLDLGYADSIWP